MATQQIFKDLTKLNFKYKSDIFWYDNPEPINTYLDYIKETNILNSDIDLDNYKDFVIFGVYNTDNYIITSKGYDTLYISIGQCSPLFWYKFTDLDGFIETFATIYEIYNPVKYPNHYTNNLKGFMGNENMLELNIHDIETHFTLQKYTDKLIWGSMWNLHPFRQEYLEGHLSYMDSIIYTGQAMRQKESQYTMSVLTAYSKSMITIHDYKEAFIVEVKYNPINTPQTEQVNNLLGRGYKSDMPIDIILALINFPFLTWNDIIIMKPFTLFHFYVVMALIGDSGDLEDKVVVEFKKMVKELNSEEEKDVMEEIENYLCYVEKQKSDN